MKENTDRHPLITTRGGVSAITEGKPFSDDEVDRIVAGPIAAMDEKLEEELAKPVVDPLDEFIGVTTNAS